MSRILDFKQMTTDLIIPSILQLLINLTTEKLRLAIWAHASSMSLRATLSVNWKFRRAKTVTGTWKTPAQSKKEPFIKNIFKITGEAKKEAMMTATASSQEIWVPLSLIKMYLNQQVSKQKQMIQSTLINPRSRNWE